METRNQGGKRSKFSVFAAVTTAAVMGGFLWWLLQVVTCGGAC